VLLELAGTNGDVKLPLMSFLESLLNATSGFAISLVVQWLFLPAIGVAITFEQNVISRSSWTFISVAWGYG
jgi:hypothetical protein